MGSDRLIPTRVKADSFRGFQTGASQIPWWRTGGSPCGQGLRFAQTMTRPSFGHWRKRAGTRVKVGGCWRWPRSTTAAPGPKRRGSAASGCSRFGPFDRLRRVVRFNAHGPDGLIDGKAPGNSRKLNDSQRQALVNIVESGPMPAIHGVVRWRLKDLTLWIWEEFQISLSETTLSRELRSLGYRKLSARPRHYAQNPEALEAFKKNLPATLEAIRAGLPKGTPLELWWQDEARVGQKNKIARRWARRGTRPRAPHDQRTSSVSIFGAICPQQGKGAALVLPRCDTQAMSLHLAEVAQAVAPRSPWGHADGPGRMAPRQGPRRARQSHAGAAARPSARIEPGREHLAVSARQLVVEPRVRLLPRHRRSLLRRVEQAYRPALDHHVHRPPGLGQCMQCMMISAGWYKFSRINSPCRDAAWSSGLRVPACVGWPAWLGRGRVLGGGLGRGGCGWAGAARGRGG